MNKILEKSAKTRFGGATLFPASQSSLVARIDADIFRDALPELIIELMMGQPDREKKFSIDQKIGEGLQAMYSAGLASEADILLDKYLTVRVPGYNSQINEIKAA